jgi:homopolymeric O-antigen transport system permease protein
MLMKVDGTVAQPPTKIIKPSQGWIPIRLDAIWAHRELLYFLVWRDIKVRYKQTLLGVLWAVLQPLTLMLAFSIFFGRLAKVPSDGLPYPVFTFCALIPWQLFAHALTQASNSLVEDDRLITKVYFPRLVIPLSAVLAGLVDFVIAFTILVALMLYYRISPTGAVWTIPMFVFLAIVSALAVGLWLSALNVRYRDVRYTLPFITQFWFFISPVAYPSSIVPESWRWFYALNPMVGVIEGFRWALLGKAEAPGLEFVVSSAVAIVLFICGLYYFRRMERTFADVV